MKKMVVLLIVVLLLCIASVSAVPEIWAPSGTIETGDPQVFNISMGGLDQNLPEHNSVIINLFWNPEFLVVEDIAVNSTLADQFLAISDAYVDNSGGTAYINLNTSGGWFISPPAPILYITIRATNQAGSSPVSILAYFNGTPVFTEIHGTIVTNGQGQPAARGAIYYPSGSIAKGSTAPFTVRIGNLTGGYNVSVGIFQYPEDELDWIPDVTLADISLNTSISGVTLQKLGDGPSLYGADVSAGSGVTQVEVTDFLDVTLAARGDADSNFVEVFQGNSSVYRNMPSNGFRVLYPFASVTEGEITLTNGTSPPVDGGGGGSAFWFPNGALGPGAQGRFPVLVSNISNARSFFFMIHNIETDKYVIDGIIPNSSNPDVTVEEGTFINNPYGFADISLNHPTGITATTPTPLVDIIFHATRDPGWSFPMGMPFHITHDQIPFDTVINGSINSSGGINPAITGKLVAPSGTIPPESEVTYQVLVGNLTNVNNFSMTLWHTSPAFNITDVRLNPAVPGTVTTYFQDYWNNWAIYVDCATPFSATTPVPLLDITIRTNTTANTIMGEQGSILFQPMDGDGEKPNWAVRHPGYSVLYPFGVVQNGTITIGNVGPRIIAPFGSVMESQQIRVPVLIANLSGAHGIGFNLTFDPALLRVYNVTLNATTPDYGEPQYDGVNTTGVLRVAVISMSTEIAAGSTPVPLVDVTFEATNKTGSSSLVFIPHTEWSESPIVNENPHLFDIMVPGQITVTPLPRPDLVLTLLDAPRFVKKNNDESVNVKASFRVDNIGDADAGPFKIEAEFLGIKESFTEGLSGIIIPVHSNLTYIWNVTVIPNSTDRSLTPQRVGNVRYKELIAGINNSVGIAVGKYTINMTVDSDNWIYEINETNNFVSATTEVTRPDLKVHLFPQLVNQLQGSNTTIMGVGPAGTYRISYGVQNIGNVSAIPTHLNISINGVNQTVPVTGVDPTPLNPVSIPALDPGAWWNLTPFDISVNQYSGRYDIAVYANYDRIEKELPVSNNYKAINLSSFSAVSLVLPQVSGGPGEDRVVSIRLSGISADAPVTSVSIPFQYDPAVCYIAGSHTIPNVILTNPSYGRVTVFGSNLEITSDTIIANITLQARDDSGRSSVLNSTRNAMVTTTGGKYLELNITSGSFRQQNETDAGVNVFTPPRGPVGNNQTISVTVFNLKAAPVTVNANVTVGHGGSTVEIWQQDGIVLTSYQSQEFSIPYWVPTVSDEYWVNASISGDDTTSNNLASQKISIEDYQLSISGQNKFYWESWYGYNKTVFDDEYFWLGTYYTANQGGMVNGTVHVWYYDNWTPVDIASGNVMEFYYYPPKQEWYGYNSEWNYMGWYWIRAKELGRYRYSLTMDARGKSSYVNGTIEIREPYVDIKVVNSTAMTTEVSKNILFPVYNRTPSEQQYAVLTLAAGAEGRTLQGLQYLIGYPHGCPEQTNSPALAAIRTKQYYESRGALTPELNATLRQTVRTAIERMIATDGYNAQQLAEYAGSYGDGSGGWGWGKGSTPSMFYTYYPNYVYAELINDNDASFWNVSDYWYSVHQIDLNASATWLLQRQQPQGNWQDWGYISNDVEWTGAITSKFAREYSFMNATVKSEIDASMVKSLDYLTVHNYNGENAQAVAHSIYGLVAIRDHGIGNVALINDNITLRSAQLESMKQNAPDGVSVYWPGSWWSNSEGTAHAVLALNKSGYTADNETIRSGIRYLVGQYAGGGGWGSTRSSAAVINTLTQVQPKETPDFNVNVEIKNPVGLTVYGPVNVVFDAAHFTFRHELTEAELGLLYRSGSGNANVVLSGKSDTGVANPSRLISAIDSREKVPRSIALSTGIDEQYIDPIATDFTLGVSIPNAGHDLKEGIERDVEFTVNNNLVGSTNQTLMILEISTGSAVNFTGSLNAADKAYWKDPAETKHFISHMSNVSKDGKAYVYLGSDDESKPSILGGETKTFYVPLTFLSSGNITVEARVYPMYNDTWMAIGSGATYVKGYGNITLNAVNETNAPVMTANFFINGASVAPGTNTTKQTELEGTYAIAIQNGAAWVNATVTVSPGDTTTYTAQFGSDTTIPHIATVVGATDEVSVSVPTIQDTVNASSANHWNAAQLALKNFTSSIASSGGLATLEIDLPTVARNRGIAYLNDTLDIRVHNATSWYSYTDYTVIGTTLRINNVNTADIDQISIGFLGRKLGDANNDRQVSMVDATLIARYLVFGTGMTGPNDMFYGDTDDSGGIVRVRDIINIARHAVGLVDDNYAPV